VTTFDFRRYSVDGGRITAMIAAAYAQLRRQD